MLLITKKNVPLSIVELVVSWRLILKPTLFQFSIKGHLSEDLLLRVAKKD
jgi:hypothetical protein